MAGNDHRSMLDPPEGPGWRVLRLLGPAVIAIGALATAVGILTGQSLGAVSIDLLGTVLGVILLLVVRWR